MIYATTVKASREMNTATQQVLCVNGWMRIILFFTECKGRDFACHRLKSIQGKTLIADGQLSTGAYPPQVSPLLISPLGTALYL